jgi:prepilin-type N-terminal cleavage/methylation domain-containing protein
VVLGRQEHETESCVAERCALGQSGFSLIEVLVAVAISGFLTLALSSGIIFLIRTNASLTVDQQLQRVLGNLSESARSLDYASCDDAGTGDTTQVGPAALTADAAAARIAYIDQLVDGPGAVLEKAGVGPSGDPILRPTDDWRPVDGITIEVLDVAFWAKVTFAAPATPPSTVPGGPGAFGAACPFEHTTGGALVLVTGQPVVIDDGAQQLTLRASLGDRSAVVQVVKADRSDASIEDGP